MFGSEEDEGSKQFRIHSNKFICHPVLVRWGNAEAVRVREAVEAYRTIPLKDDTW
jgi:hypothetical protein